MALRIGSNTTSISVQRQLAVSADKLSSVFERLSSGSRINKASDDAAGLAISESLEANGKVYTRGVQNINDGISVVSIADATLTALSAITVRITELCEQSANGTYTNKQREAMDAEAQALSKEYFRVSRSTSFNGINLFDGSVQGFSLQAGIGSSAVLSSSLGGTLGTGNFGAVAYFSAGASPYSVKLGDLNADGILDIVTANNAGGTLSVLLGKGDGNFENQTTVAVGAAPTDVALGDLNGDGIFDIVASNGSGHTVSVLLGKGDGTFGAQTAFSTGTAPNSVRLGDLNGDGALDIVTANLGSANVSVLLGKGDGTFAAQSLVGAGATPESIALGDLNGDNVLDIAVTNISIASASVILGLGGGAFSTPTTYATGAGSTTITLADLNGDRSLDIVAGNAGTGGLSVLLGKTDGTFGAQTSFSSGGNPFSVTAGDVNGDGFCDLVSANANSTISAFLGKGDGSFTTQSTFATGASPNSVALGDLNGDGVLDAATATMGSATVLLGTTRDGVSPLLSFSLKTKADALQALSPMKKKIEALATQRGVLGAFQARLSVAASTLMVSAENFKAAESRIRDADFAEEAASMTSLQILRDAAAAVLGQANQQPLLALQLLHA